VKICMLTKYPPIEGGVSSAAYWLARALGARGHEVHVVTNALEVEDCYRERIDAGDPRWNPPGVYVHSTLPGYEANPMHIPYSPAFCERLAGLALRVAREYAIDVVDCWYLMPYAAAGHLVAALTGVPLVVRHAGSDVGRLARVSELGELFRCLLGAATIVVSSAAARDALQALDVPSEHVRLLPQAVADPAVFNPAAAPLDAARLPFPRPGPPIIMHAGKIPHYWQSKGLGELLVALARMAGAGEDFRFLLVADGPRLEQVGEMARAALGERFGRLPFVPPWDMPGLLRWAHCMVLPERGFEVSGHYSQTAMEALLTGTCAVLGQELRQHPAHAFLEPGREVLTVDPLDVLALAAALTDVLRRPERARDVAAAGRRAIMAQVDYDSFISDNERIYGEAAQYRRAVQAGPS